MAEKWIQGAIKHPGALHRELGVPEDKNIPEKKLEKAAEKGGKLGQRARLAETLKGMHHAEGGRHEHREHHEERHRFDHCSGGEIRRRATGGSVW